MKSLIANIFKKFEQITNPYPDTDITQPPTTLFAYLVFYSRGFYKPLIIMAILSAIIAVLEVSMFGFMGQLVDWLSKKDPATFLHQEWPKLLLMAIIMLIVIPAVSLLASLIVHQSLLGNYPMSIRWLSHRYLLKQSYNFYQNDFAGRISAKVMQNSLAVREAVMKILNILVYVLVYFTSMFVIIAHSDWRLVIPMIVWLIGYIALQIHYIPKMKKVATEQADARSLMTGRIVDSYSNISTVKQFSHTKEEETYAKESMDVFMQTVYRQMRFVTGISFFITLFNYLLTFFTAAISIWLWTNNAINIGAIAVAVSLSLRINSMSQWIIWEIGALFENIGIAKDGMSTLAKPIDIVDIANAKTLQVNKGEISFNDISFHYGKSSGVLDNLNLTVKAGEKIGLVGVSGAGKSTLVNLLLRFYDLEKGTIKIDEQDISQVTQESLRKNIGIVSQDTSLLHRSIEQNIGYGKANASEEEILAAAKQAQAHDFIMELSDSFGNSGYKSQVGERGVKLSGGQRQRISIARVLLKNAPILILDEATSALDSEVESVIQEQLYQLMQGKTVIAIAHRLSTIAKMDRLIILDKGRISEIGTHEQLIASKGLYYKLWQHQTNGFLGDLDEDIAQV